ncbi:MAG: ATP-binding protein [Pirellulales bacterium]|nr:ATP-binding protein [Pirellulales bacterium]
MDQITRIPLPDPALIRGNSATKGSVEPSPTLPFLVGPENRLVEVLAHAVLESAGVKYNPLVVVGESGTGKSHLAQGLAAAYQLQYPGRAVVCQPAVDFARRLTDAVESQSTEAFRRRYRSSRLLVLEDLTRLAGNEMAQRELVATIDAAVASSHQIIVTAATRPGRWIRMILPLQSRLEAGLCVPLAPPGVDTRLAILRDAAERRGLPWNEPAARVLANGMQGDARELIGSFLSLHAEHRIHGRPIDGNVARAYVAQHTSRVSVELRQIASATARTFALSLAQVRGRSQRREAVLARSVAMYLARRLTDMSLEQLGGYFGGRDHTTVLHSCRKIEQSLGTDPAVQEIVQQVENILGTRSTNKRCRAFAAPV